MITIIPTVVVNKKLMFHFVKSIVLTFMHYHFSTVSNTQNGRRECKCASASLGFLLLMKEYL